MALRFCFARKAEVIVLLSRESRSRASAPICAPGPGPRDTQRAMSQENVEIVRSILEPFKGIDVASIDLDDDGLREALGSAYSPDFELRTLDTGIGLGVDDVYRGWDGLVQYLRVWLDPFSEYQIEPLDYV